MVFCARSFNSYLPLVFIEATLNSGIYAENIVQLVLLIFLQQEDDEMFQQDNANSYKKHVLLNLQYKTLQFTWCHDCQVYLPLNI